MAPDKVQEAIDEFNGRLFQSDKILDNEKAEANLPDHFKEMLSKKNKPSNWYSGDQAPDAEKVLSSMPQTR